MNDKKIQCLTLVILIKKKRFNIVMCGLHYHVMDHFRGIDRLCSRTHSAGDGRTIHFLLLPIHFCHVKTNVQTTIELGMAKARLDNAVSLRGRQKSTLVKGLLG